MFDITQGRSAGMQVQAITRSGTNTLQGSVYGYFRSDKLNAEDFLTHTVLPYENQQIGGTVGGPIVKDKLHYFVSYEYEREPGTSYSAPAGLPGESFTIPYKISQKSFMSRVDYQASTRDRFSARGSTWRWANPFVLGANAHPSNASSQANRSTNILGTWSRVLSDTKVMEVRVGYDNYWWAREGLGEVGYTYEYRFPGLTVGKPYNFPQWLWQDYYESRVDLSWHRNTHDLKIGGEFIKANVEALWYLQREGIITFTSLPNDIATRIPQGAALDPSQWNFTGLDSIAQKLEKNFNNTGWSLDVPQPTWAIWFGDAWHVNSALTVNYGVRWDENWNVASTPNTLANSIVINGGASAATTRIPGFDYGDYGYKKSMRDNLNIAPRGGFTWNVGSESKMVVRGGSGLYFTYPQTMYTYSPQLYSNMITASFANDGKAGWLADPTRGIDAYDEALAVRPPQAARIMGSRYRNPFTWQSSIGFQRELNDVTAIEADLTHYTLYRDMRTIDPNLYYDPATGYNKNPALGRPNKDWGQIAYYVSTGTQTYTALAAGLTRRLKHNVQGGVSYTLMFSMKDDGAASITAPAANNNFDYLDGEWATSTAFQRHTLRLWGVYLLPWGFSTSVSYAYGSGNRFAATIATSPYGKVGSNRLNLTASGGPTSAITIPAAVLERWEGPAVINSGDVIPRDGLDGLPYHKVDVRLTKDIKLAGNLKASLIGEVYNLFNHANYLGYQNLLSATNPATTARFGQPSIASIPRQGQLAFRIGW